jgi:DNA polymerase III delta prime subunit
MFFKVSDKVVFREIEDKIVLINLDTGFYYSLNELGRFIFNEILKKREIVNIVDEIQDTYEVPEEEAREDLQEFLQSLKAEKIVVQER